MGMFKRKKDSPVRKSRKSGRSSNLPVYLNTLLILGWYFTTYKTEVKEFLSWLSKVI